MATTDERGIPQLVEQIKLNPLNSLGWQALGMALRWSGANNCSGDDGRLPACGGTCGTDDSDWRAWAHGYFEMKLTAPEKEEEFWKDLLKEKE